MEPMHPTYLPFRREQLKEHFALVKGGAADERHLAYYDKSLQALGDLRLGGGSGTEIRRGRQMEKDERFWVVTALLSMFYANEGTTRADLFANLMKRAQVDPPPDCGSWSQALAGELFLYFEVNLPSPRAYTDWLRNELDSHCPIPYLRESAQNRGLRKLEGSTHVDAMLIAPGTQTAVLFEAKVLSDLSTKIDFDLTRNQLARIIDVALEPGAGLHPLDKRSSARTYVALLTPEILSPRTKFRGMDRSRLYGWLMRAYMKADSTLLAEHLPHRTQNDLAGVPSRLGWATWEECNDVLPGACPWMNSGAGALIEG